MAETQGFTLIEALVAMAVLATGGVALLSAVEDHAGRTGDLTDRVAARWVAEEYLAQRRLGLVPGEGPVRMMGRDWRVEVDDSGAAPEGLVRLDVRAGPVEGRDTARMLVRMTGHAAGGDAR